MAGVIHNSVWRSWRILNRRIFFIHSQPFPSRIIGSLSWSADAVVACCRKTSPRKLRRGRSTGRTYWTSMGGASSSWGLGTRFDLINEHTFHVCRLALFFGFWGGGGTDSWQALIRRNCRTPSQPRGRSSTWSTAWRTPSWTSARASPRWSGWSTTTGTSCPTCPSRWARRRRTFCKTITRSAWGWPFYTTPPSSSNPSGRCARLLTPVS